MDGETNKSAHILPRVSPPQLTETAPEKQCCTIGVTNKVTKLFAIRRHLAMASGTRVEETSTHVHHECETPKAVWAMEAEHWKRATGEDLEVSSPLLTIRDCERALQLGSTQKRG